MLIIKHTIWYFYKSLLVSVTRQEPIEYFAEYINYYSFWISSLKKNPIDFGYPWMAISAIHRLEELLSPTSRIFEYGAGGSTAFFLDHIQTVVCVEHEYSWSEAVRKRFTHHLGTKLTLHFQPPIQLETIELKKEEDPELYRSNVLQFRNVSFENYVKVIDEYDDNSFDLIMIDGRSRVSCIRHAIPKTKPGGYILLDNSDRPEYKRGIDLLQTWRRETYCSPMTYSSIPLFGETSLWQKPNH